MLFIGSLHKFEVIIIAAMESPSTWIVCLGKVKAHRLNHLSIREGHIYLLKNENSVNIVGDLDVSNVSTREST